jgi:hypothetical protein
VPLSHSAKRSEQKGESATISFQLTPGEAREILKIRVWINVFIPGAIAGSILVPGKGPHAGKTMIPTLVGLCFLTDQRSFSPSSSDSSRVHTEAEIDVQRNELATTERCDYTVEVNCDDGSEGCKEPASAQVQWSDLTHSEDMRNFAVDVTAAASDPCALGAPDVDYQGRIAVQLDDTRESATISFNGLIEPWPAFEMYAQVDEGPAHSVFALPPLPGATPWGMFGAPNRPVMESVSASRSG